MQVAFTKLQISEAIHKLTIVRDEPDLLDSYELTETRAAEILEMFWSKQSYGRWVFELDTQVIDVLVGEFENCIEIADANLENGDLSYLSYRNSMRNAIAKMKAVP